MLNYIVWNLKPQLLDLGSFEIRYYSLLFAAGFVIGYILMARMLKKEGYPPELLEKLTIYVVLGTIIGARLGHCLFYEFDYYSHHPLEIILPWKGTIGKDFQFTGYQGLASHGGAIGILIAIYFFVRKTKVSYLWTLDHLAILVALAAFMIRTGNLMNSEIYGKPTHSNYGIVFAHDFSKLLTGNRKDENIEKISFTKAGQDSIKYDNAVPLNLNVRFSNKVKDERLVAAFAENRLKYALTDREYQDNVVYPNVNQLVYTIGKENRNYVLKARVYGIPKHPTQIYEALAYLIIFFLLLGIYYTRGTTLKNGIYLGIFLVLVFTARFIIEFWKEDQETFERTMALNMGQILSIPFVAGGIVLIILRWGRVKPQ